MYPIVIVNAGYCWMCIIQDIVHAIYVLEMMKNDYIMNQKVIEAQEYHIDSEHQRQLTIDCSTWTAVHVLQHLDCSHVLQHTNYSTRTVVHGLQYMDYSMQTTVLLKGHAAILFDRQ